MSYAEGCVRKGREGEWLGREMERKERWFTFAVIISEGIFDGVNSETDKRDKEKKSSRKISNSTSGKV